ncbi:hypothetical protein FEM48_Zijuj07G0004700 [Ziziphus jujuba var. spinosa]|uniref:RING-type domain-containing protein n=1 Tax=Ziziphus jujuba var. spinosa TaxID=714518 RepID=A0A978V1D5_ZIZJJ|nr:hypothetical protein FEM48_Zijuj07G0004700 [Ziziphus jujuba var. spinosa]
MENHNAKLGSGGGAKAYPNTNNNATDEQVQSPDPNRPDELQQESIAGSLDSAQPPPPPDSAGSVARQSSRTPFTNLNQVDADLALARTLQEQVPIFFLSPSIFAYARALQDAEDREMAARLLALADLNDGEVEDADDHGVNSQETWEEVDPDELSYEELLALGEVVGTESRGLSADSIASLPSVNYKTGSSQIGSNDSCVICRLDYEDGETLTLLSCKHSYHVECINNWLKINKVHS